MVLDMLSCNCYKLIAVTYIIGNIIITSIAIRPSLRADPRRTVWIKSETCNRLVCETPGNSIPTQKCVWYKNGKEYNPSRDRRCGTDQCSLSFFLLNANNNGNYSCSALGNYTHSNTVEIYIQECLTFIHPKFEISVIGTSAHVKVKDASLKLEKLKSGCIQIRLTNTANNETVFPTTKLNSYERSFHDLPSGNEFRVTFEVCDCEPLSGRYSISKKFNTYDIVAECVKTDSAFEVSVNSTTQMEISNQTYQYYFSHLGSNSGINKTSYNAAPVSEGGGFFRYFQKYNLTLHHHYVDVASSDLFHITRWTQFACPSKYYDKVSLHVEQEGTTNLKLGIRNSHGKLFAHDPSVDVLVSMFTNGNTLSARRDISNITLFNLLPGTSYQANAVFCLRKNLSHNDELCSESSAQITVQTLSLETEDEHENSQTMPIIISPGVIAAVAIAAVVVIAVVIWCCYYQKRCLCSSQDSKEYPSVTYHADGRDTSEPNCYYTPMDPQAKSASKLVADLRESLANKLIEESHLAVGKEIGEGQFGFVHDGLLRRKRGDKTVKVAVKFTKAGGMTLQEKLDFLKEAQRMENLYHTNVMRLIGIYMPRFQTVSLFNPGVVLPFMKHGDLKTYLVHKRMNGKVSEFTLQDLLHYSVNVARGMRYLEEQNIVHRDLAARNCMLDDHYNVVISDFGLARSLYARDYYRQSETTRLPVKWMAMESLSDNIFSAKSDVWSYGVTVWEILSLGQQPYAGLSNGEMQDFLHRGKRLEMPTCCPKNIWFNVVYKCWYAQVDQRLSFAQIIDCLEEEITELGENELLKPLNLSYPVSSSNGYEEVNVHWQGYNLAEDSGDEILNPPSNAPLLTPYYDENPINL